MKTILVATLLAVAGPSYAQGPDQPITPAPTGPMRIGTTEWRLVDSTRRETWVGSEAPREVKVVAWYPADPASSSGPRAPYLREGTAEVHAFATRLRVPEMEKALGSAISRAVRDAPPARTPARFPLLVFSPGYTAWPSAYTALLEELASQGYVVLSINHPYETTAARLLDGSVASFLDDSLAPRPSARRVFAEWTNEDSTMAAVTRTNDVAERRRLLAGYMEGLNETGATLRRWVADTKLVLDRLASLPANTVGARVVARVNSGAVGVFGHSMGGVVAGQFCLEDRRCRAGLNLDGSPQSGTMIEGDLGRPFLMVYSAREGRRGANDAIYTRAASRYYRADIVQTLHADFTDIGFWSPVIRERGIIGTLPPERTTQLTRAIVLGFFDQELRGRRSPLLAGTRSLPEVGVQVLKRGK